MAQIQWFKDDLNSCLIVAKLKDGGDNDFPGGLNYTAALVAFCFIDFLTGCFKGKSWPASDDVAEFMTTYFKKYEQKFEKKEFSKKLYEVFRHGLAHQWSPKGSGVAMDFRFLSFFGFSDGIPVLNVPEFFKIIDAGSSDYLADLTINPDLNKFVTLRYEDVLKNDAIEAEQLKRIYDEELFSR